MRDPQKKRRSWMLAAIATLAAMTSLSTPSLWQSVSSSSSYAADKSDTKAEWISLEEFSAKNGVKFRWSDDEDRGKLLNEKSQIVLMLDSKYALLNDHQLVWLSHPLSLLDGKVVIGQKDVSLLLGHLLTTAAPPPNPTPASETKTSAPIPAEPKAKLFNLKRVVIDPGHGGHDYGAINRWGGREKDVTLSVSIKLMKLISEKLGLETVITRSRDLFISLPDRAKIANRYKADETLFVSIHCNSVRRGSSARGVETYVFDLAASDADAAALARRENAGENVDHLSYILNDLRHRVNEIYSLEIAKGVQKSIVSRLSLGDRNVKRAPFYVLSKTNMPAILVELGFISNRTEQDILRSDSHQGRYAEAILQAIIEFEKNAPYVN